MLKVNVARVKLQSRKTVDSSESLPLSHLNQSPVLTTCPKTDLNVTILLESGYHFTLLSSPIFQFLEGIFLQPTLINENFMSFFFSTIRQKKILV